MKKSITPVTELLSSCMLHPVVVFEDNTKKQKTEAHPSHIFDMLRRNNMIGIYHR